jgi:flagellar hook assembly protein FlgD
MFMRSTTIVFIAAVASALSLMAETVTKSSASFHFPDGVGVNWNQSIPEHAVRFFCQTQTAGSGKIRIGWSLPAVSGKTGIAIYTMAGALVKTIPISSKNGMVTWDITGDRIARGVYFASLTAGTSKKTLKLVAVR